METTTRMGSRSSSRHGPAVQFSGRVRKWQKTWTKSDTSEQLQMFKWLPVSGDREEEPEELPPRKYRFLPFDIVHAEAQPEKEPSPVTEVPDTAAELDTQILDADPATAAADLEQAEGLGSEEPVLVNEAEATDGSAWEGQIEGGKEESAQLARESEPGADTGSLLASAVDQDVDDGVKDPVREEEEAIGAAPDGDVQIREALESLGEEEGPLEREAGRDGAVEPPVISTAGEQSAGRSTAGEIAESLVATGLVDEGDAAKVEARPLANVVSEEEKTERVGQGEATSKEGNMAATVGAGEKSAQEKKPVDVDGENKGRRVADDGKRDEDGSR